MGRKKKAPQIRIPEIKQLPSGSWHTRVMVNGKRIAITKPTYDECVAEYLAIKKGVVQAKGKGPQQSKTLDDTLKDYINARRGFRSPATICGYERYRKNTFRQMMRANVYTATDAQWQTAIQQEKAAGRSPKYIKNAWGLISSAIEEETGRRPTVMLYPKDAKPREYLEPEQIDIFIDAIKDTDVEIPALLCLSSLRRSEMLALKWANVDMKNKTMHIQGAKVEGEHGLEYKPQNKTDKSRRTVPIIPPLYDALSKAQRTEEFVVTAPAITIFKHIKKICVAAGLPEVGMHGLRHSFASLAYHLQIPEMIAAEIGGWNDLATMHNIYTHLAEKDIAKRGHQIVDYFDSEAIKNRKLATELATENKTT